MKVISSFLASVCASCVFVGAMQMLCPQGNMEKAVKYVLSLVFLCMVISVGGISIKTDIDIPKLDINGTQASFKEMQVRTAEYVYGRALEEKGINYKKITVYTDNSQTDSIVINKVCIETDWDRQAVIEALGEAANNFTVEVLNE